MNGWFDKEGREIVGIKTFDLLSASVGIFGLSGMFNIKNTNTLTPL